MKILKITLLLSLGALFACSNQNEIERLQTENAKFKTTLKAKDSVLHSFMESISNIENNLIQIKEREMKITLKRNEKDPQNLAVHKENILSDIEAIDQLILENKDKVAKLNAMLSKSESDNSNIRKLMNQMKTDLEDRIQKQEDAIALLKTELHTKTSDVKKLMADIEILKMERKVLGDRLNEGYYCIGDFKELKNKSILRKDGGLFGIATSIVLEDNYSTGHFSEIDIRSFSKLAIQAKKVELITNHDRDSYDIASTESGESRVLIISNPAKFWEKSSYLVILTKK